jgi:NAD(P)-dependent dehydrogenase (short-subunit alcohol dehydrogenase family)
MPTRVERCALVTGATDGLGRAVAERLAAEGLTVLLHGRDPPRVRAAAEQITASTGNGRLRVYVADFASLAQVRALAEEVRSTTEHLHVLVNNAGIGTGLPDSPSRQTSADGYELRFAVNHLAGFLLALELLPLLRASAPARVVNVASIGQQAVDFDDVMIEHDYSGSRAYKQSKLAQITFGFELARRVPADEVTVSSLHPATYMPTKIVVMSGGQPIDSLEDGTEATVRLAISPDVEGISGRFYDHQHEGQANPQAYDEAARQRLWQLSLDLTGAPAVV